MSWSEAFKRKILNPNRGYFCRPSFFPVFVIFLFSIFVGYAVAGAHPLSVHFIDVGYGDCIFVELPDGRNLLMDAGGHAHAARLTSYLRSLNVSEITTAIITHPHTNHFEGFFDVLKKFPIRRVFINGDTRAEDGYNALLAEFRRLNIPIKVLKQGNRIKLGRGVILDVLHPQRFEDHSANGASLVTRLRYKETAFLLTADIESVEQDMLLKQFPQIMDSVCIKIPHHGGPLSGEFIKSFRGKTFVVSTGENSWGWPKEEELRKLEGNIYRTDRDGTVTIESDGKSIQVIP